MLKPKEAFDIINVGGKGGLSWVTLFQQTMSLTKFHPKNGHTPPSWLIAARKSEADIRFLIECKRYAISRKVDVSLVRALYGAKTHEKATKAILATTSTFTYPAMKFSEAHRWELELRDMNGILDWIKFARGSVG